MEEQLNLFQKLAKIRSIADVVSKDKKGYNYRYASITEILAKVTAGMKKYGVSLVPSIVQDTASVEQTVIRNTKVDKSGKVYDSVTTEMVVKAAMMFRWVDDANPDDYIDVPWFVTGSQADPSQAFGSGLTYCTRYFLCNYFQIALEDTDVDTYRSKQKLAAESEGRAIAEEIIGEFDSLVRNYLVQHEDKADEVKKFISKYVKGANYKAIKEPSLAAKLLNEFDEKFFG